MVGAELDWLCDEGDELDVEGIAAAALEASGAEEDLQAATPMATKRITACVVIFRADIFSFLRARWPTVAETKLSCGIRG